MQPAYDVIVTTATPNVVFPFVLRHVDSLCEVEPACCEMGDADQCPDEGLRNCVGTIDPFCTESGWDSRCVNVARVGCGATCSSAP